MKELLLIENPRRIKECIDALDELDIDKLWLRNMTEMTIQERWDDDIWPQCQPYDRIYMVGDDSITRPQALEAVRELLDFGHPVVTAYANLDRHDWRLNIDRAEVRVEMGVGDHDFYTLEEALSYPEKAIPTSLCGFCPTGMSRQHWEMFPFRAEYGSDLNLSVRLRFAGVPIVAAREAFCWHVKENWNVKDSEPRKKLLVGVEPAAVDLELAAQPNYLVMHGRIIIPLGDLLRYPAFLMDFANLDCPAGTDIGMHQSASVVQNLNESIWELPDDVEWIWLMTDDHVFPREILRTLLDHEKDVIVPLVTRRTPPFTLLVMKERAELFDERMEKHYPAYLPYELSDVPDEPFTVAAAGGAGMLIRRKVLDAIGYPWFSNSDGVYLNEDFQFCEKIQDAGFEIWCDPHCMLGHISQAHVWPAWHEGQLGVKIDCGGRPGENEIIIGDKKKVPVDVAA